ncbi:MAG: ethanolamine ammonia-lyase reactivating factor EutA [Rhodobacter sp.]|nr:ethanolamine ammonia-lyase reactivating factor EutA [Rhodobacter sp.]
MPDQKKPDRHTIDDHMFGDFYAHDHGPDADHEHDDIDPGPLEDNPIWQRDNVALTSVGIDIGSAGTQVIFSTIHLQRKADSHASRYVIVDRATAYQSPVSFTPYAGNRIDAEALGEIIDAAYGDAGIRPGDIDTGVVILTGEALRRENARAIAGIIAEKGGDFVTATAGNHMEAMLAAYGSGAAKASHDGACRILNVDIGGGTTKLALCEHGHVRWTAALHVGGRLIACENGVVTRLEPVGRHHANSAGVQVAMGAPCPPEMLQRIASHMADVLQAALTQSPMPDDVGALFLTDIPTGFDNLAGIMVSGGVGEYVAGRETRDFGDLGYPLGAILRARVKAGDLGAPLLPAAACIRATALGASEYSVQLSGQTSTITSPGRSLPRRSMQVLKPDIDLAREPSAADIATAIGAHFEAFDLDPATHEVALAFEFDMAPDYAIIRALADGIARAMRPRLDAGHALYVMIDGDIAQTLGGILRDEIGLANDLLILDGLSLRDFDYIDLGKIRLPSFTVPVTVKSLLFQDDPRGPCRQERIQFQPPGQQTHSHDHPHGHSHHDH